VHKLSTSTLTSLAEKLSNWYTPDLISRLVCLWVSWPDSLLPGCQKYSESESVFCLRSSTAQYQHTWSILFCWRQISRFCRYCWTNVIVSLLLPRYVRTYWVTCIHNRGLDDIWYSHMWYANYINITLAST